MYRVYRRQQPELLDIDAGKLRCLIVAAYTVNVSAELGLAEHEGVDQQDDTDDDSAPRNAFVSCENPADSQNHSGNEYHADNKDRSGNHFKLILLLILAVFDLGQYDNNHAKHADDHGHHMDAGLDGNVGNKAVAECEEALLTDNDSAGFGECAGKQSAEDEHRRGSRRMPERPGG